MKTNRGWLVRGLVLVLGCVITYYHAHHKTRERRSLYPLTDLWDLKAHGHEDHFRLGPKVGVQYLCDQVAIPRPTDPGTWMPWNGILGSEGGIGVADDGATQDSVIDWRNITLESGAEKSPLHPMIIAYVDDERSKKLGCQHIVWVKMSAGLAHYLIHDEVITQASLANPSFRDRLEAEWSDVLTDMRLFFGQASQKYATNTNYTPAELEAMYRSIGPALFRAHLLRKNAKAVVAMGWDKKGDASLAADLDRVASFYNYVWQTAFFNWPDFYCQPLEPAYGRAVWRRNFWELTWIAALWLTPLVILIGLLFEGWWRWLGSRPRFLVLLVRQQYRSYRTRRAEDERQKLADERTAAGRKEAFEAKKARARINDEVWERERAELALAVFVYLLNRLDEEWRLACEAWQDMEMPQPSVAVSSNGLTHVTLNGHCVEESFAAVPLPPLTTAQRERFELIVRRLGQQVGEWHQLAFVMYLRGQHAPGHLLGRNHPFATKMLLGDADSVRRELALKQSS